MPPLSVTLPPLSAHLKQMTINWQHHSTCMLLFMGLNPFWGLHSIPRQYYYHVYIFFFLKFFFYLKKQRYTARSYSLTEHQPHLFSLAFSSLFTVKVSGGNPNRNLYLFIYLFICYSLNIRENNPVLSESILIRHPLYDESQLWGERTLEVKHSGIKGS